jgi:hypothetical protein
VRSGCNAFQMMGKLGIVHSSGPELNGLGKGKVVFPIC